MCAFDLPLGGSFKWAKNWLCNSSKIYTWLEKNLRRFLMIKGMEDAEQLKDQVTK